MLKKLNEDYYLVSGLAHYAIVHEPSSDTGMNGEPTPRYRIDVIFDEETYVKMLVLKNELGCQQDIKTMPDTKEHHFQFRRDLVKDESGKLIDLPPKVVDANNQPLDKKTLIGNGSEVQVLFSVRPYGKGKKKHQIILSSVKVTKLVVWTPPPQEPPPKAVDFTAFDDVKEEDLPF